MFETINGSLGVSNDVIADVPVMRDDVLWRRRYG